MMHYLCKHEGNNTHGANLLDNKYGDANLK